jgi:hypothetical protein
MFRFYYYGDCGDTDGYTDVEFETLEEIYEIIEAASWYIDYRDGQCKRTSFKPIKITEITEVTIMDADEPNNEFDKYIDSGKLKFEEKNAQKRKADEANKRAQDLKLLAELKKKYEGANEGVNEGVNEGESA